MQKVIRGTEVSGVVEAGGENGFAKFYCIVKKGHEECGDSAFMYADEKKTILAVFDGVSGEAGASSASSVAADTLLRELSPHERISDSKLTEAVRKAQSEIKSGLTTAALVIIEKGGSFIAAGVGDSPVYSLDAKGKVSLELPLARTVGEGDSILKFFYFRNLLTAALGGGSTEAELRIRRGKLKKGEMLIIASDGLTDNLYITTYDGYISESSGLDDLSELIGRERDPEKLVAALLTEIGRRLATGRNERKASMLVPKEDDIAIIAVRMRGTKD